MRPKTISQTVFILLLTSLSVNLSGQSADSVINLKDNLYVITGLGGNVSFLTTNDGVVVVDAGTVKNDGHIIQNYVKEITDKPIKYLILTHYHYDHAQGVGGFPDNTIIIGHENVSKNLNHFGPWVLENYHKKMVVDQINALKNKMDSLKSIKDDNWQNVEKEYNSQLQELEYVNETFLLTPEITFKDEMIIALGEDTVKLIYPGRTHTDCSIFVEFTEQNVLVTGDFFFNKCMPYIDFNANCDTENWIAQAKKYANKQYDYVVPGHGEITKPNELIEQANYLTDLKKEINELVKQNKSLEEVQQKVKMTNYSHYDFQFMLGSGIDAVYKELTQR